MLSEVHHVCDIAVAQMLLEVVGLEELNALLGDAFAQFTLVAVDLICLKKQIYDSACAIFFIIVERSLRALKDSLLLLKGALEFLIWEVSIAALVQ